MRGGPSPPPRAPRAVLGGPRARVVERLLACPEAAPREALPELLAGEPIRGAETAGEDAGPRYPHPMYSVDDRDRVVELLDIPRCDSGAPCPLVLLAEGAATVVYFCPNTPAEWDGSSATMRGPEMAGDPAAIVRFERTRATSFGAPNDEAFAGHPLASRGLRPYGAFEVLDSSWIRGLEKMNRVHPRHSAAMFAAYRHFVLTFHDTTFECVAVRYACEHATAPLTELVAREALREGS